jgi:hypothetical protein
VTTAGNSLYIFENNKKLETGMERDKTNIPVL